MQTLEKRNTYTPRNVSQVSGDCDLPLKVSGGRNGVASSKTFSNHPDATLTATRAGGATPKVVAVGVLNLQGEALMPCSPRKARVLLKQKKAKVVRRTPFVIQLNYPVGNIKQDVKFGMDSGYKHIGISAASEKKEFISADVQLRNDIVNLLSEKREYRRNRRNRKTRYRQPRFLNRGNKKQGWFAPSIQHKIDSHIKVIRFVKSFLPITEVIVEVANFDIQKIKNPDISGAEYQQGDQMGFWNVREYVLFRDGHKCQHCFGKSGDKILNVHHIKSRKTAGNRPDVLITLCETCHTDYHAGKFELEIKPSKEFKAETFMSMVRWKIVEEIKKQFPDLKVNVTFGYITKTNRIALKLPKSHINDAFAIMGGCTQERAQAYFIKQVRRCNRKLFKGDRSHIKNTAPRFICGFQRYDKVLWQGKECFVFGRRATGYFDLRTLEGDKINASAKAKELILVESFNTMLINRKQNDALHQSISPDKVEVFPKC